MIVRAEFVGKTDLRDSMKSYVSAALWVAVLTFIFFPGAFAQTTNPKWEVTNFGAPFPTPTGKDRDTASVAADGKGLIFVLRRADPPVLVYNRDGKLVDSWGTGLFVDTHNIDVDRFGFVWIGDRNGQAVYKFTKEGKQLMTIGTKGMKGDDTSEYAFNRASDVFVAPNGDIYIADGYVNHRVVQYTKDGKFIRVIGGVKGDVPGKFDEVHGVQMDSKGRLIIMDHHSNGARIQIFSADGRFIEEWPHANLGLMMGSGLTIDKDDTIYIGDTNGEQIKVVKDGKVLDTIGGLKARPHQITLDPGTGAIFLADTAALGGMVKKVVRK
jgi:streptogramin lyase